MTYPVPSPTAEESTPALSAARERIAERTAVVAVLGLGYVGWPLARLAAQRGFRVLGFEIDAHRLAALSSPEGAGRAPATGEPGTPIELSDDPRTLARADVLLVCVPTPLGRDREPDLSAVESATGAIAASLRPGQLVVLESTTYPGTTDERLRSILDGTGLVLGRDYFLAYSPERQDPGNLVHTTATIPKLVGGVDPASAGLAEQFYSALVERVVRVRDARTAEAAKLLENVFRAVNIALVNELKIVYDRLGIDVWEAIDAASTKPFGFQRFDPGPGWGGHCIPVDPFYLGWVARRQGVTARFVELAGEMNARMPEWVLDKLAAAIAARGGALEGARVLVLGLAYKRDIDDCRESPAFEILRGLVARGANVGYHDPYVPELPAERSPDDDVALPPLTSTPLDATELARWDAVVLVTDHSCIDYAALLRHAALIVDTRGIYRSAHPNVVRA